MILYIKELKPSIKPLGFYEMLYKDEKYIERLRKIAYDILVRYGKIATNSSDSVGNKKNMNISVSVENDTLDVDFHWGKTDTERAYFNKKIADMTMGTTDIPSIEELVDWVRGKERFFKENPFMLKNNASFFNKDIVGSEREYAERLQVAMEESGTFSYGNKVFRGQSQSATMDNPIRAEYTHKSRKFIDVINEKIEKELADRFNGISEILVDRILARNAGSVEYVVAILDDGIVNIINVDTLDEWLVEYVRGEGIIEIEYDYDAHRNEIMGYANKKAPKVLNITKSLYRKVNRTIRGQIKSGSTIDINKYQQMILDTINKIKY